MVRSLTVNQDQQINFLREKKGAHIETFETLTIAYYETEIRGKVYPAVVAFRGKSKKPFLNCYFSQGITAMADHILGVKEREQDNNIQEKKRAEEKKANFEKACAEIKEGDIFYNSWGYEQTNLDFYLVTGRPSKCFVEVLPIACTSVEATGPDSDRVIADPNSAIGKPMRCKIDSHGNISTGKHYFQKASRWDGRPKHRSWGY